MKIEESDDEYNRKLAEVMEKAKKDNEDRQDLIQKQKEKRAEEEAKVEA